MILAIRSSRIKVILAAIVSTFIVVAGLVWLVSNSALVSGQQVKDYPGKDEGRGSADSGETSGQGDTLPVKATTRSP